MILNKKKKIITNQQEQVVVIATIILNMIVIAIEIKPYQAKNTSMKLNHTCKTLEIISKNLIDGNFN